MTVDTHVYIVGSGFDINGSKQQGIYIAEIDTLGSVLRDTVVTALVNDIILHIEECDAIKTENGFTMAGQYFRSRNGMIFKLDDNFKLVHVEEYTENSDEFLTTLNEDIIPLSNGYLIRSNKQHLNYKSYAHLIRVAEDGTKLWERSSRDVLNHECLMRLSRSENHILYYGTFLSKKQKKYPHKRWMSILDEEGIVVKDTIYDLPFTTAAYCNGGYIDDEIILITPQKKYLADYERPEDVTAPALQAYSHDLELLWEFQYDTPKGSFYNGIKSIVRTNDGNYVASITQLEPEREIWDLPYSSYPIIHIKFTPQGSILWERRDAVYTQDSIWNHYFPTKTIQLESGSIITCGKMRYQEGDLGITRDPSFLIKFGKDGCFNGDCSDRLVYTTSTTPILHTVRPITIAPNPATHRATISIPDNQESDLSYRILQTDGKSVRSGIYHPPYSYIDLQGLHTGIYLVEIRNHNRRIAQGKLLVR